MIKIFLVSLLMMFMATTGYCQPSSSPVELTITSDHAVFKVGDAINIDFHFKNVSSEPIEFFIFEADFPIYHGFEFIDIKGNRIASTNPEIDFTKRKDKRLTILPGESVVSTVPLNQWKLAGLGHGYIPVGNEPREMVT